MKKTNSPTPPSDKLLSKAERFQYEEYKRQHIQALEDYHEFGKAPVGSPERMAAYVSQLSLHNLKAGAEVLRDWKAEAPSVAEIEVRISELSNLLSDSKLVAHRCCGVHIRAIDRLAQLRAAVAALRQEK